MVIIMVLLPVFASFAWLICYKNEKAEKKKSSLLTQRPQPTCIYIYYHYYKGVTPSRQNSKVLYPLVVRRRGKTGKHGKVGVKRWWVLVQTPYSLHENGRQSPRVESWNQGDKPPDAEETQEAPYR